MARRLLNLLTGLSLLLFVAVVVLWVRSHRVNSVFGYYTDLGRGGWYRNIYFSSYAGRLTLVSVHQKFDGGLSRGQFHAWDDPSPTIQPRPEFAGFGHFRVQGREMGWTEITVPYWSLAVVAGIVPVFTVVRMFRQRRGRQAGICPSCGYDLRATPDKCPECGAVSPSRPVG